MEALKVIAGEQPWSVEQADCLEFLRALPDDSVNLVVGSPPYEMARLYLEGGANLGVARRTEEWVSWMVEVFQAAQRACTGVVAMVVAGQTKNYRWSAGPALLMAELHRVGMNLRNPPIFSRVGIPGSGGPDWLRSDYEWIVCTSRPGKLPWSDNTACGHSPKWAPGGAMSNRQASGERVGRRITRGHKNGDTPNSDSYVPPAKANPGNIIHLKVGGGLLGSPYAHENEAPFPLDLASFFVRSFCPPNGVVADCFSGSGTTCHASVKHGRRFVGCDLRQSQVDLAHRRLAGVTPDLFAGAAT